MTDIELMKRDVGAALARALIGSLLLPVSRSSHRASGLLSEAVEILAHEHPIIKEIVERANEAFCRKGLNEMIAWLHAYGDDD